MQRHPDVFWNEEKNQQLKSERGLSFEEVVTAIENGRTLDDIEHHHADRKDRQRLLVVEIGGYACVVPYVRDGQRMFLKTVYYSRTMRKKYLVKK